MSIASKVALHLDDTVTAYSLKSDWQLRKSYGLFLMFNSRLLVRLGLKYTPLALKWRLPVTPIIKATLFEQFCGGETLEDCDEIITRLGAKGVKTILDYGAEAKAAETEYENTCQQVMNTIEYAGRNKNVNTVSVKITGISRFELLEKIHRGDKLNALEKKEYQLVADRLHKICCKAAECQVQIFFDAEETWIQRPIDELIGTMMQQYNRRGVIVFNTIQLYTKNGLSMLLSAHQQAMKEAYYYGAKLVRGAYMEKERKRARLMKYPSPIHENKKAVDRDFNKAIDYCLDNLDTLAFCCASHNEQSNAYLAQRIDEKNIARNHKGITFGQLYGMGDYLTFNLARAGYNALKLVPYGPVNEVIPYLLRRAEENSSVDGQLSRELMMLKKEMQRRRLL